MALFRDEAALLALLGIAFAIVLGALLWLMVYLESEGYATAPFFNWPCLVLVATIVAAAALAWQRRAAGESVVYWIVAYAGLLGIVLHQLGWTPGGQALVRSPFGSVFFVIGLRYRGDAAKSGRQM